MSSNSLVVEELLIKSIEAQNRTTHAIRAFAGLFALQMLGALVGFLVFQVQGVKALGLSLLIFAVSFVLGFIQFMSEYWLSSRGLKDDVASYADALESVK